MFIFDTEVLRALERQYEVQSLRNWIGYHSQVYLLSIDGRPAATIASGTVGPPFAGMTMEEMIVCGVKRFVSVGAAGVIADNIYPPALLLATSALRDEGLSHHYLEPSLEIAMSRQATERLRAACEHCGIAPVLGRFWTTDAIYGETAPLIAHYKRLGVMRLRWKQRGSQP